MSGSVNSVSIIANSKARITGVEVDKNASFVGPVAKGNLVEDVQTIPDALSDSIDTYKENTAIFKEFGNVMPDIIKNIRMMNDAIVRTNQNLPALVPNVKKTTDDRKKELIQGYDRQNWLNTFNTGSGMIQSAAGGNVAGSFFQGVSGVTSGVNNLSKMADVKDMTNTAKGLLAVGGVLTAGLAIAKGGKALADSYKDAMPEIFGTGKAFGTTDDDLSMDIYKQVNTYNKGTGLDLKEFNSLIVDLRKQGVGNYLVDKNGKPIREAQAAYAADIAHTTSAWAYATNADPNQYANLAGLMSRYGGSTNVAEDFNYLVSAGKASGLNDTQIPEFLTNIQKVMEDGIAKGFSRSATEVADTMLMFSKLSGGNAFWQGEQGARIINQANTGLASATSLSKTSDIIAFRAIANAYAGYTPDENGNLISKEKAALGKDLYQENGDYVNTMMLLEKGLNPENFGSIMGSIFDVEGSDNTVGQIERLRQMFGLNYTGASRVLKLYQDNGGNVDKTELENVLKAPENQNNETKWQKSVNQIAESLQTMGKPVFNLELEGLSAIEKGVTKIANFVYRDTSKIKGVKYEKDNDFLTPEYYENRAIAEDRIGALPTWKQNWFKDRIYSPDFNPGVNGEGWLQLVKELERYDPTKQNYNSPDVRPVTVDDMPSQYSDQLKRTMAYKQGYKVQTENKDNNSISDDLMEMQPDFMHSLLQGKDQDYVNAFMQKIEDNREHIIKLYDNKSVDRSDKDNEQKKIVDYLNTLVQEVEKGITLNINKEY